MLSKVIVAPTAQLTQNPARVAGGLMAPAALLVNTAVRVSLPTLARKDNQEGFTP